MILRTLTVLFLIIPFLTHLSEEFYNEKKAEKEIRIILQQPNLILNRISPNVENIQKDGQLVIYRISCAENKEFRYALFTQAKGRFDFFDYMIVCESDLKIKKVRVLKYRSEHGGEIASKKWLQQFENYSGGDLQYGKDISALSGATYSAGSITEDVKMSVNILRNSIIQ